MKDSSEQQETLTPRVQAIVKPPWAEWQPDIFIQTLPGIPYMMPQGMLPARDCANCLFQRDDWRDGGWCYMFKIEPTGDKCGQFKSV
jgi:hypothetical protein